MKYSWLILTILVGCTQHNAADTTQTATATATVTDPDAGKITRPSWGFFVADPKFKPEWRNATLKAIQELGPNLLQVNPDDGDKFFPPGYKTLNIEGRKAFWLMFISALIRYESNYDPSETYQESFKDNAGANVISRGLLQISVESGNGNAYRCGVTTTSLHDPVTNLRCGVRIMNYWMGKDKVITKRVTPTRDDSGWRGIARYWGPMRKDEKILAVAAKTAKI